MEKQGVGFYNVKKLDLAYWIFNFYRMVTPSIQYSFDPKHQIRRHPIDKFL